MNSIVTAREESLRPSDGEERGSEVFMLYKNMISSSSCGRPWSVGMAAIVSFLLVLDFRRRLCCEAASDCVEGWVGGRLDGTSGF